MPDAGEIETTLDAAITDAVDGFVTRWVAVLEIVGDDGERALFTASSDDLTAWDALGMFDYALANQRRVMFEE